MHRYRQKHDRLRLALDQPFKALDHFVDQFLGAALDRLVHGIEIFVESAAGDVSAGDHFVDRRRSAENVLGIAFHRRLQQSFGHALSAHSGDAYAMIFGFFFSHHAQVAAIAPIAKTSWSVGCRAARADTAIACVRNARRAGTTRFSKVLKEGRS